MRYNAAGVDWRFDMTTIQKTIRIPEDHHVHLDLEVPGDFPVGEAEVLMIISPLLVPDKRTKLDQLAGCLSGSPHFARDPVQLQKEMRDEWE